MQFKKTKIICTIGPSSWDEETLRQLAEAGMNVARLNFSHGTYQEKQQQIDRVRKISKELSKPIAIYADMQGPKIRLGEIEGERKISKGEEIQLSINPVDVELPMQFDLSPFVKKGQSIYLNDGLVELKVLEIKGKAIRTKALNSGVVSSHKGVNLPDTIMKGVAFTDKDREDAEFALKAGVDILGLSFVQSADDLKEAKAMVKKYHPQTKIIVKIEKKEAISNLESIIKATDAVMVARGDLAIETPASEVPIIQQKIIKLARQYYRPVVVATQMLESMVVNPRPTRAETSDVANAVLDQVDAVMLSAESASGKYPVEAVKIMKEIILSVEENPDFLRYIKIDWRNMSEESVSFSAITSSAASIAHRIKAKLIVVATATGRSAIILSSFRPGQQILAVTHNQDTNTKLSLVWGVYSLVVKPTKSFEAFLKDIITSVKDHEFATKGDKIVVVTGSSIGTTGGTDMIKVVTL